jgi:hypothetical protein
MLHKLQHHHNGRPPLPPRSGSRSSSFNSNCSTIKLGKNATELQAKADKDKALHNFMNELMSKCCINDGDNENSPTIHISPDNAKIPRRTKSQDGSSIASYCSEMSTPDSSSKGRKQLQQLEYLSPTKPDKESRWSNASPSTLLRTIQTAVSVAEGTDSPSSVRLASHNLFTPSLTDISPSSRSSFSSRSSPKDLLHLSMGDAGSGTARQGSDVKTTTTTTTIRRTQSLSPYATRRSLGKKALPLPLSSPLPSPPCSRWDTSCSPEQSSPFRKV